MLFLKKILDIFRKKQEKEPSKKEAPFSTFVVVHRPQRTYQCVTCGKDITGKHLKVTSKSAYGVFVTTRMHIECAFPATKE